MKKILIVHSLYRTRGGEERLVEIENQALQERGYQVRVLTRDDAGKAEKVRDKLQVAKGLFLPGEPTKEFSKVLEEFDPQAVHFHNIMPNWGYATVQHALNWALRKGRKVVTTIHNQRYACANGLFFRDGEHCQLCFDRQNPVWGAFYNCRGNVAESAAYAAAISWAWVVRAYNHPSHTLIALNPTTAARLKRLFPVATVTFIPNPVEVPPSQSASWDFDDGWTGSRVAIIGRLSPEKGIQKVLKMLRWSDASTPDFLRDPSVQLVFAGDGPLRSELEDEARRNPRIKYIGQLSENDVPRLIRATQGVFHASVVEEQSPTVLRMAAALGAPVYTWQGRLKNTELQAWGELLTAQSWSKQLTKIFN